MGNKNGEKNHVNGKNNVDNNTIILDNGNLINVPTWKAWYRHPRIWYEWGKHLASIDCPIFAADALSESLKRGLVEMLDHRKQILFRCETPYGKNLRLSY